MEWYTNCCIYIYIYILRRPSLFRLDNQIPLKLMMMMILKLVLLMFFFASSTLSLCSGYMDGAVQSGERAAREVLGDWVHQNVAAL